MKAVSNYKSQDRKSSTQSVSTKTEGKKSVSEKVRSQNSSADKTIVDSIDLAIDYSTIFELAPTALIVINEKGIIFQANKSAVKQLNFSKEQLIGSNIFSMITNCHCGNNIQSCILGIEAEDPHRCEIILKRSDEKTFDALLEIIKIDPELGFYYASFTNISELKIHEHVIEKSLLKEKHLNEMKSRFISLASHEFRTPLASILSSAWLMSKYHEKNDAEKLLVHIKKVMSSVVGLNDILNDFISYSLLESAMERNNPVRFNLVDFVENIIDEHRKENLEHQFIYYHNEELQHIIIDRVLFKICLGNIIGNAIKYSSEKKKVEINTIVDSETEEIIIAVKDHGIGIPDKDKEHIFEQFYRASNTNYIQGTGLGLNITYKLMSLIGGSIKFVSEWKKGTTFFLTIPQNKVNIIL
ncbi:MAG: ATP-binding protein [Bacteroidota bacterium]